MPRNLYGYVVDINRRTVINNRSPWAWISILGKYLLEYPDDMPTGFPFTQFLCQTTLLVRPNQGGECPMI